MKRTYETTYDYEFAFGDLHDAIEDFFYLISGGPFDEDTTVKVTFEVSEDDDDD